MSLQEYLTALGLSDKEIRTISNAVEHSRMERPFQGGKTYAAVADGIRDPLVLLSQERNLNISKGANKARPIGEHIVLQAIQAAIPKFKFGRLGEAFTPGPWMIKKFKDAPFIGDLWHKSHEMQRAMTADNKLLEGKVKELAKVYPKRKLREEAFIKMMSQDKRGRMALEQQGIRPIDGPVQYEGLVRELNTHFRDLGEAVNKARSAIGLKPINLMENYLPMMLAHENFLTKVRKTLDGDTLKSGTPNLVLDSPEMVTHRHGANAMLASRFAHTKRGILRKGAQLEPDPLRLLAQYGMTANKHIHFSPLNSWIKELAHNKFVDPTSGKMFQMKHHNKPMYDYLVRWSNRLAGRPNVVLPENMRFIETAAQTLNNNLTLATLGYSFRTILIQPTALLYTMTEHGVGRTLSAAKDTMLRRKNVPIDKSDFIANRVAEAGLEDFTNYYLKSPAERVLLIPKKYALEGLKFADAVSAKIAWRAAFSEYKHLGEAQAIRMADQAVARTHGSGFVGDLSAVQMNAVGKSLTLWQTFTINQLNFLAKDVLNIRHPERNPAETVRRVMTYVVGSAIISQLFEEGLGIESPLPAPEHALMKGLQNGDPAALVMFDTLMELGEFVPMLSSGKFGSHWLGAPVDYLGDVATAVKNEIPAALDGSPTQKKRAQQKIIELVGKGVGIPGTGQIMKYQRARDRGEDVFGSVLGRYDEEKMNRSRGSGGGSLSGVGGLPGL